MKLPRLGIISNYVKIFFPSDRDVAAIAQKRVLCLGFSESELHEFVLPHDPASVVSLTLWEDHMDAQFNEIELVIGDICKRTPFEDGAFDAVVTLSVLEHVSDLNAAMREISRVLSADGSFFSLFGPVWSSSYGHHLYVDASDTNLNFSLWALPTHLHLLCSPAEISAFYRDQGYGEDVIRTVIHQMYVSDIINRLMFEDYLTALLKHFQLDWIQVMQNDVPAEIIQSLRSKFPGYNDFSTYGAKFRCNKLRS